MSNYRRNFVPGGKYFFTLVTWERQPFFADEIAVELLRESFRYVRNRRSFELIASVVLPDHLHCIWQLPDTDMDYSTRWQMLKTACSRKFRAAGLLPARKKLWQPRYWEHTIRDETDHNRHLDYITTRSSMDMCRTRAIGHLAVSVVS